MIYARHLKERYRVILGYVGTILVGIALLLLLPLLTAFIYGEQQVVLPVLYSILLAAGLGGLLRVVFKVDRNISLTIQEGGIIVLLAWLGAIFFSAMPFLLSGQLNFTQAIFEMTSGWTTTGLSVVDFERIPRALILWRSITQFVGGAGFTVLMLSAVIGPLGLGMFIAEGRSDKLLPNVAESARMIMTIHISFTLSGVVLYILAGMSFFDALNHALCVLSTGGFSPMADSIGAYNNLAVEMVSILLMILGATSYAAHFLLLNREVKNFLRIDELRLMWLAILFFIPLIVFFSLWSFYGGIADALRAGAFQVVSSLTGTGFSTVNLSEWSDFPRTILILLMFLGGMAGSTSGGIKLYRLLILLKSLMWHIRGYFLPRNVVRENMVVRPDGPVFLKKSMIIETANFVTMYVGFYMAGIMIMMLYGHSMADAMFEMASTLSTVGLSVGITAPDAPLVILWTQIISMLMGRLEFFVLFFAGIKIVKDMRYMATHTS